MRTKKVKSTGRFGPRYGRKIRLRVKSIDETTKKWHDCPKCRAKRVKRLAAGIWQCRKCDNKFAGGAYSPAPGTKREERETSIVPLELYENKEVASNV